MPDNAKKPLVSLILQLVLVVVVVPLMPMLISWRWNWWEAWFFALTLSLGFVLSRALAARRHPGLLAERAGSFEREDAKPWDRILAPLMALGGLTIPLLAGLEERFHWSPEPFSLPVKATACAALVLVYAFASWAMIENAFFSGVVRLQTDRGHSVCASGPYRFVRHPGYLGGLLSYLAMPLILDSAWAFVAAALLLLVGVARTRLEDRTLQQELPGYRDYALRVRYRLLPGIW